jgi:very-long-chain (3R)-3-hydroxyacyl-CoA dehydratase
MGWVKAPLMTTVIQVVSRLNLVFFVSLLLSDRMQEVNLSLFYGLMIMAWSITEIVRYPYYVFGLLGRKAPFYWTWTRYTWFYILYPLGASSEWVLLWILYNDRYHPWLVKLRYDMPNCINMIFDIRHILLFLLMIYVPGFLIQYNHMRSQRRKYVHSKSHTSSIHKLD